MNAQQIVTQAASQGARQGALTNDNKQIQGAIKANMLAIDPNISDPQKARTGVTIFPAAQDDPGRARGKPLTVIVSYKLPFVFESLPSNFQSVTTTIVSQMQCDPTPPDVVCPP